MLVHWQDDARKWAIAEVPRESCGLVVLRDGSETYDPCNNLAEKDDYFVLDPVDYAKAEDTGTVVAIVHSHVKGPAAPSPYDVTSCNLSGLPWWIYAVEADEWICVEPKHEQEVEGR
jgi:proteasome lid subunit RPN8/RPN11|tara:strand:- start:345 stop:695 length:351 start_codon:yes stop_codon:yes gene_type:complete